MEEKKLIKPIERIKPGDPMPTGMPPRTTEEERTYFVLLESRIKEADNAWITLIGKDSVIKFLTRDALNLINKLSICKCYVCSEEDPVVDGEEFIKTHTTK